MELTLFSWWDSASAAGHSMWLQKRPCSTSSASPFALVAALSVTWSSELSGYSCQRYHIQTDRQISMMDIVPFYSGPIAKIPTAPHHIRPYRAMPQRFAFLPRRTDNLCEARNSAGTGRRIELPSNANPRPRASPNTAQLNIGPRRMWFPLVPPRLNVHARPPLRQR